MTATANSEPIPTTSEHPIRIAVDSAELSTILAALRYYQQEGLGDPDNRPEAIHDIATDGGENISLDAHGIDTLCERINCVGVQDDDSAAIYDVPDDDVERGLRNPWDHTDDHEEEEEEEEEEED